MESDSRQTFEEHRLEMAIQEQFPAVLTENSLGIKGFHCKETFLRKTYYAYRNGALGVMYGIMSCAFSCVDGCLTGNYFFIPMRKKITDCEQIVGELSSFYSGEIAATGRRQPPFH